MLSAVFDFRTNYCIYTWPEAEVHVLFKATVHDCEEQPACDKIGWDQTSFVQVYLRQKDMFSEHIFQVRGELEATHQAGHVKEPVLGRFVRYNPEDWLCVCSFLAPGEHGVTAPTQIKLTLSCLQFRMNEMFPKEWLSHDYGPFAFSKACTTGGLRIKVSLLKN